jgi:hypothetical protein
VCIIQEKNILTFLKISKSLTYKNVSCYNWKGFGGYTKTQYAKLSTCEYDLVTSPTFQKVKIWGVGGVC